MTLNGRTLGLSIRKDNQTTIEMWIDLPSIFFMTLKFYTEAVLSGNTDAMAKHSLALETMYQKALEEKEDISRDDDKK